MFLGLKFKAPLLHTVHIQLTEYTDTVYRIHCIPYTEYIVYSIQYTEYISGRGN